MKTITTLGLVLSLAALLAGCHTATVQPTPPDQSSPPPAGAGAPMGETRLVDRPDEIIIRLDSGLTVIAKRYAAAPVVSVRMHVKAGAIWEDGYAGSGISHLFEHLLAGGATARRSEEQSRRLMESMGASSNAFTSDDATVYFIDVPSRHTDTAIDLLADWVTRPTFPQADVARELGVVQRELERGNQEPDRRLWQTISETRYLVHPARFPVIGLKPALARLTRQDILNYYRAMYVPSNVVVAVVGDVQPEAALATVKRQFADFTARADRPIALPAESPVLAPRTNVLSMDVKQVRFAMGFPTVDMLSDEMYPLDVMMYVLAAGENSRLRVELRDRRKLALSISAVSYTPSYVAGSFLVTGVCLPENWTALREAILAECARLAASPVSETELAVAKRQVLVEHIQASQTAAAIANRMAASQLAFGDAHFDGAYVRRIGAVTADQVQAAARKYFDTGKLLTSLVIPKGFKLVNGAATRPASQPEAGIAVSPVRKITLDNGLTVLLRRNSAVPLVSVQMYLTGGLLAEKAEQNGIGQLMTQAALRGTKTRSAAQIFAAFENAGGQLSAASGRNTLSFSASVLADQLDATLPVFADVITRPAFPPDEVDRLKKLALAAIARVPEQLGADAGRFFFAKVFGDYAYGRPTNGTVETVMKLTSDDLVAFHRQWVNGRNAVLAIFGDIDLDAAEKLVRQAFGPDALPAGERVKDWPVAPAPAAQPATYVHRTKLAETAEVDIAFPGVTYTDPDYYPLTMLDTMISGYGLPGGWLHETLRGRELVYMVHASNLAWRQAGLFHVVAQCEPKKTQEVIDAIAEQIARARRGEFTKEMLVNARSSVLAGELMDLQTNDELAARCALDELLGRGYDSYQRLADRINAVTMDDVIRVARTYLANPVTCVTTSDPAVVKAAAPPAGK